MKASLLKKIKRTGAVLTAEKQTATSAEISQRKNKLTLLLFLSTVLIIAYGLLVVYSAIFGDSNYSFAKQIGGAVVGVILMLVIWRMDYKALSSLMVPLIIINIVLILSPLLPGIGVTVNGARSWIRLGIQFQPAEFAKVTVILQAASVVAKYHGHLDEPIEYLKTLAILLIPFVCIMLQPDLGTGLVYLFIAAVALIVGGARLKYLLLTLAACIAAIAVILLLDETFKTVSENGTVEYHFLKNYQRQRLFVFLDPDNDTSDSGYNLKQAQIAIGSGGFFGKGFMNSTQAALKFLPEAPTDFIFCVLAEQFGFVGFVILIGIYTLLIVVSLKISSSCQDLFGKLIVYCVVGMWVFQIFENIGMTCGVMPITGIPLPFISYGSSFMVVNLAMLGMIASVAENGIVVKRQRRYQNAITNRHIKG